MLYVQAIIVNIQISSIVRTLCREGFGCQLTSWSGPVSFEAEHTGITNTAKSKQHDRIDLHAKRYIEVQDDIRRGRVAGNVLSLKTTSTKLKSRFHYNLGEKKEGSESPFKCLSILRWWLCQLCRRAWWLMQATEAATSLHYITSRR